MQPQTKTPVSEVDTPALVIDLDAMDRNIARMADFAKRHGVRWRPHAKMHKSAELALLLIKAGAVGACVQKTSEALALADGGVRDIYISNEVIAPAKLARVAQLAHRLAAQGGRLGIAVDSEEGIARLARAMIEAKPRERTSTRETPVIDVYVEIDVGQHRCGVEPGPAAVALVKQIVAHPELRFAGLQAYHGKAQHMRGVEERHDAISAALEDVLYTRGLIEAEGISVPLVTGAGTGTLVCEAASGVYGELQAGSFLFMDADYGRNEPDPEQPHFEHALFVKSQVISAGGEHAVCDAGHKSHAIDSGLPQVHTLEPGTELEYQNGGDEHGILVEAGDNTHLPAIGSAVWLIPGHCDPTVNLHDFMVGVRGGLVNGTVERIIRVDARGAVA